jgi:hypothetical protein
MHAITNEQYNEEKIMNILSVECSEKIENVYFQKRVFMPVIAPAILRFERRY